MSFWWYVTRLLFFFVMLNISFFYVVASGLHGVKAGSLFAIAKGCVLADGIILGSVC